MKQESGQSDLPGWTVGVTEVSNGVYRAVATSKSGFTVEATGMDPDVLIEECLVAARGIHGRDVGLKSFGGGTPPIT